MSYDKIVKILWCGTFNKRFLAVIYHLHRSVLNLKERKIRLIKLNCGRLRFSPKVTYLECEYTTEMLSQFNVN